MSRAAVLALLLATTAGCTHPAREPAVETDAARSFDAYPLYWVGERFEGLELERVDVANPNVVSLGYGSCEVEDPDGMLGPEGGSCQLPLTIQVSPLCAHIDAIAAAPIWRRRSVRGAPVGSSDSAPVLLASRVQVKVYGSVPSEPGLALRALRALRSANAVAPVIAPGDPIPAAPRGVLDGRRPCATR